MNIYTHATAATYKVPDQLTITARSGLKLVPVTTPAEIEGLMFYDSADHTLKYRSNTVWHDLTLVAGIADTLADKRVPTHIASGSYRQNDSEHMYVSSNSTLNVWKPWSQDSFVDFTKPYTFTGPITFSKDVKFNQTLTLANTKLENIAYPTQQHDVVTKVYVDNSLNPNAPTSVGYQTDALLKAMIAQVTAEHDRLQALWTDRKAFKKTDGTAGNYSTDPSAADYWLGAGLLTAMISTTQRLRNAGRI